MEREDEDDPIVYKEIITETSLACADTGRELDKDKDVDHAYVFGSENNLRSLVRFSKAEMQKLRSFGQEPGIRILGFKPIRELHFYENIKHAYFIYPSDLVSFLDRLSKRYILAFSDIYITSRIPILHEPSVHYCRAWQTRRGWQLLYSVQEGMSSQLLQQYYHNWKNEALTVKWSHRECTLSRYHMPMIFVKRQRGTRISFKVRVEEYIYIYILCVRSHLTQSPPFLKPMKIRLNVLARLSRHLPRTLPLIQTFFPMQVLTIITKSYWPSLSMMRCRLMLKTRQSPIILSSKR